VNTGCADHGNRERARRSGRPRIAHVTQKHLLRTFEAASQLSIRSGVLLAALASGAAGGSVGLAAAIGGQAP